MGELFAEIERNEGIRYDVDETLLDQTIPRFILQPIVENALYDGLGDEEGVIEVRIAANDGHLNVEVKDNGAGMTEEEVSRLPFIRKRKKKIRSRHRTKLRIADDQHPLRR